MCAIRLRHRSWMVNAGVPDRRHLVAQAGFEPAIFGV
jgi:hypothetical protein